MAFQREFDPTRRVWRCPDCGTVNAWNWDDAERAAAILCEEVAVAHGSCFDNVCGECGRDYVATDSPIMAECYTHQEVADDFDE